MPDPKAFSKPQPDGKVDARVYRGKRILRFTKKDIFSRRKHNELVDCLNPLMNIVMKEGATNDALLTDANLILQIKSGSGSGSGSGGAVQLRYKSMQADYIVCRTWDGATEGSTDINIAKPYLLRASAFTSPATLERTVAGITCTLSAWNSTNQTRTVASSNGTGTERVSPMYVANDLIYAVSCDHTGVTVSNVELTLLDGNNDSRKWAWLYGQEQ
jgi:hypothetical protein